MPSKASLRNYIGCPMSEELSQRACSDIYLDVLSWRPSQSQQLSFTELSSQAIFIFLWIRLSFIHKKHALSSLFCTHHVEKLVCFYELQISWVSLKISLSDSVLETKKLQVKVSNLTCQTISICKQLHVVNFVVCKLRWFDIFDSFSLVQPIRLFEPF